MRWFIHRKDLEVTNVGHKCWNLINSGLHSGVGDSASMSLGPCLPKQKLHPGVISPSSVIGNDSKSVLINRWRGGT